MFRKALNDLINWKNSNNRKPLIIRGARQVGKTWLMKEFGRKEYEKTAYINFDNNERMKRLFNVDLDVTRLITGLELESEVKITPQNTLIIFDEIQEVPGALTSLKYFFENKPEYHIIAAGSLLGVALHYETSFPVGKVSFLNLYPFCFIEFIQALGREDYISLLRNQEWDLISSFKDKYIELLKQYYYIGGMPEAIAAFIENKDYKEVREIQKRILIAYEQDLSKHAPNEVVPRIRLLWNVIPSQLAKDNKKFIYGLIKEGARAKEYELAMMWLVDCGLVHKVSRVSKPHIPLRAYEDLKAFKLFSLDVGLLAAMTDIDVKTLLEGNDIFTEFKGALTEQYVMQQLITENDLSIFYWSSDKGLAEIDFLIQYENKIIPIEVKAEMNLQAKSLKAFKDKYKIPFSLRLSMRDYHRQDWILNLPLYAIDVLKNVI